MVPTFFFSFGSAAFGVFTAQPSSRGIQLSLIASMCVAESGAHAPQCSLNQLQAKDETASKNGVLAASLVELKQAGIIRGNGRGRCRGGCEE